MMQLWRNKSKLYLYMQYLIIYLQNYWSVIITVCEMHKNTKSSRYKKIALY